jgi:TRAP-type C4-dicarboxylate transport system permease large subunit
VVLLGSLYTGKATPVESAALGTFMVFVFGLLNKGLNIKNIFASAMTTSRTTAMIVFLMVSAKYFTFALAQTSINRRLSEWVIGQNYSTVAMLVAIGIIYLILGCFMDGGSIIVLTIPLLAPIVMNMGINMLWLGVYITVLVQIGQITPPMGLNLFMIQSIDQTASFGTICKGIVPYLIIMIIFCGILIAFPGMCYVLPNLLNG